MTTTLPAPTTPTALVDAPTAHRRATLPDPARMLPRDTDTTAVARIRAIATLFTAVEHARQDLALDLLHADLLTDEIATETRVYLAAALAPGITYTDVNTYVHNTFDTVAGAPTLHAHAAALAAAAALRGWTHRQALATGGAR